MYKDSVSGCGQASAPQNQSSSKSTQIEIKFPQSPSDWSLALSEIPDNWVLTPVKDKRPLRPNWQEEEAIARCDLIELLVAGQKLKSSNGKEWHCHWTGIGLRLGTVSGGVLAIDADGDLAEAKLQELSGGDLPLTPCWTSGKPGRRQLLYRISPEYWEKIKTVKIDCGQGQHLEFRWDGCQSVLPPSKHPETGQYHWLVSPEESAQRNAQNQELTEKNGEDVATAIAPDWLIEFLLQQNQPVYSDSPSLKLPCTENSSSENAPHKPVNELQGGQTHSDESQPIYPPVYSSKGTYSPSQKWTDEDWARSYLEALASWRADDYDQWVQVGMALQSVSDGLLWDWEHWSRQSSKYKPGGCERKWRSFKPSKGISIGSLAQWAKEDGWQSPFKSQSSSFQETLNRETSPSESLGNHSMRPRGQNTGKVIPQQSNNINGKIAPSYSQSSTHVSDNSVTNNSSNPFTNEQQDTLEQEQQLTLKEAVTRLIMKGVTGSDRQEALFYLSCQYHIPSQQLDRYWQQLAQELDVEQIKPEIITQVQNLLSRRNYRLDPQQIFSQEFAQLMNNCADAMPGPVEGLIVTLLATAASCVGTGAEVVVKKRSGYSQPCLIRTLLLGETGEMKSPLQKIILAPLKKLEKEALQQYQQELKDYDAAIEQGEKNLKRPQRERFMLIDCTPEEQIRIHAKSPRGFLVHHDEWGAYLKGFNKYRNGKGNDREIDLSEFNGDMYIRDRVNDDSIFLEKMAVSRSAGYQLSLMYNLIEQQDDLDGFLSRWLISAPPFPPAYKNFVDDEGNDVEVFQDLLYSLYRGLRKLPSSRYFLTLESRKIFQHWQHYLVDLMNAETHLSLKGIYPKLEAYTVRLALVLHLVEAVLLGQAPESTISGETMKRAVYLAQYFLIQNQWVYCRKNSETEGLSGFMAEIQQWATKTGGAIAARQVKNGISCINKCKKATADFIRKLFSQLAEAGYGILHGKGIHLRYEAKTITQSQFNPVYSTPFGHQPSVTKNEVNSELVSGVGNKTQSTNQQFESPPPLIPDQSRNVGQTKNVDRLHQQKSTSTKSGFSSLGTTTVKEIGNEPSLLKVPVRVEILPNQWVDGMGHPNENGNISVELENHFLLIVPRSVCHFVDVDKNVAPSINTVKVTHQAEFSQNVDLLIDQRPTDDSTGQNVDLLIDPWLVDELEKPQPRDNESILTEINNNQQNPGDSSNGSGTSNQEPLTAVSLRECCRTANSENIQALSLSDIPWETFPDGTFNGRRGRQLAQQIQTILLSHDLSQLAQVIQGESFTESMIIWVIEHLIEPAKRQLFLGNLIMDF